MSPVAERLLDTEIVIGRTFARSSPGGRLDGQGERGVWSHDLRLLRRVELFRAEREVAVPGVVAVADDGCAVRFELSGVEPGTGVLLVVELDGTDAFTVRDMALVVTGEAASGHVTQRLGLGDVRSDARVLMVADCDGDAELTHRDGVALAHGPIRVDSTTRTASWRWHVPADSTAPATLRIELRVSWALATDAQPEAPRSFDTLDRARRTARDEWLADRPVASGVENLSRIVRASMEDLASLRLDVESGGHVLGAGVPWFLTVFGRDALLASWMTLPVDPQLAADTLRYLAIRQATTYDLATDAEPGKIMHEERVGIVAERWHPRYYGSVDATPLFLMLLGEHARWTGDDSVVRELEVAARAAVGWILSRIEEDELGLLSYWRRAERGLDVQSWKDSWDSQRDHAGRVASGLIRPLEAQAYAVAGLRTAARLAKGTWGDEVLASEWAAAARVLERKMLDRCTVELPPGLLRGTDDPRAGGFLAQAVDSSGHAVDSLCSNAGHVLWAEALADPTARSRTITQLASSALDSGWGIRTMSTLDAGYDPVSHHCGSVWPHDTAICIAGIARYDRETTNRLARNLFDAAVAGGSRLPEYFSGSARDGADDYASVPTACNLQAWAAAAPLLVLRSVLGLEPDSQGNELVSTAVHAPAWMVGFRWRGVYALGRRWNVVVARDAVIEVEQNAF
jgi:glycogen debranching enzyme